MENTDIVAWLYLSYDPPQKWVVAETNRKRALDIFDLTAPRGIKIIDDPLTATQLAEYVSEPGKAVLQP